MLIKNMIDDDKNEVRFLLLRAGFFKGGYIDFELIKTKLGLHRSTIQRYLNLKSTPPKHLISYLQILAGDSPATKKEAFNRWIFNAEFLISPEGDKYTEGDIRAIRIDRDLIRSQEREIETLKTKVEILKAKQAKPARPDNVIELFPQKQA